jgi:hypothetical protein
MENIDDSRYPRIAQLLREGRGWLENGSVMGMTADGPVCLGDVNEGTERYLAEHPNREEW